MKGFIISVSFAVGVGLPAAAAPVAKSNPKKAAARTSVAASPSRAPAADPSKQPGLVTPPDMLTDETAEAPPEAAEASVPAAEEFGEEFGADEEAAVAPQGETDLPQIYRRKESVDTRFRPESRYIEHPNAAKGLIKIEKDKTYIYKVESSEQNKAASVRLGTYKPEELTSPENTSLTFEDLYDDADYPMVFFDMERQFFQGFGKLSWKYGGGLYVAQGNGRFKENNEGLTPKEQFTLFVVPLNIGVIYRLHYLRNQWIVPYAEGAFDAFCFGEVRDDDKNPALGAALGFAPAAHFSLGGSIAMGKDARSFLDLDREYGINTIYLTVELRQYIALSDKYDFSGTALSGGITAEY